MLIENELLDAITFRKAFEDLKLTNLLVHLTSSKQALKYLRDECKKKPCIIFLDLNMPNHDAVEFLKVIKANDALKKIPVIVLTTSSKWQNATEAIQLDTAGYIAKPVDYKKLLEAIRKIDLHWTSSELPTQSSFI